MTTSSKPKPTARAAQTADASSYRQEMLPLPLRIARSQYTRLASTRDRTGISIQEHVRRGIDLYLAVVEKEAIELGLISPGAPTPDPRRATDDSGRAVGAAPPPPVVVRR
jgi:hypothetical protein